jgi:hypothetical protein
MKRDSRKRGGAVTVTANVQDDERFRASVATHSTFVEPTTNPDPDAGVHATAMGSCPVADGIGKLIGLVAAPVDTVVIGAGQLSPGGAPI